MSVDEISPMAKVHAERILRGEGVTDVEMRIVTAGLMLSVDELTHVVRGLTAQLWTDEQLRGLVRDEVGSWSEAKLHGIISAEVERHCSLKSATCQQQPAEAKSATWLGKFVRTLAGGR